MNKKRNIVIITVLLGYLYSCTIQIIQGIKTGKVGAGYDSAAFDYVYVEGLRQKLLGNYGEALQNFEHALTIYPSSGAAYYQMAQVVVNTGDIDHGKVYAKKAVKLEPDNLWYILMLANIYGQEKNIDSAIVCYEKASKIYPEKDFLQLTLSRLYSEKGNYNQAEKILYQFEGKYGANEQTTQALIDNLIADKKYEEAKVKVKILLEENPDNIVWNGYMASIYKKQGESEKAREVYEMLIKRNPDNPGIQVSLCDFLLSEKQYDELFNLLNILILNENVRKEDKVTLAAKLIENDELVKEKGKKIELALMILESAYKNDDIIVLLRPELLIKENLDRDAAVRLEEIIKETPENYYAWEKLLLVYYDLKDFATLQKRGEECATTFNRSIIAKLLYATAAMENSDFDIALRELDKADILAGDNKDLKLQVLTLRADAYYRMKKFDDAFKAYDEALKMNASDLTIMNNYAYYLAEQNMKLKEAEKMAKLVVEMDKGNKTYLDTYAWVLYKRGKVKEAAKIMQYIISDIDEEDAEYYEHYGFILKKMGKCNEAMRNWELAIKLDGKKSYLKKEIESCIK